MRAISSIRPRRSSLSALISVRDEEEGRLSEDELLALVFVLFHTISWFNLTPTAMVVRMKGKRVPDRIVAGSNYVVWVLLSGIVAWIFTRGLK